MKKKIFSLLIFAFLIIPFACRKSFDPVVTTATNSASDSPNQNGTDSARQGQQLPAPPPGGIITVPFPETGITGCSYAPNYGDSIVYPQPTNQDYIVFPVNNPGPGKYFSWPVGMVIDSVTGAINLTKSETGERYMIGFVKDGTTDTCLQSLIIGGADYMDSVYVLADNHTQAFPYFDADPNKTPPCNGSGVSGPGCQFDVNGQAASQRVIVDKNTGMIDLKKTLDNGLLGLGGAFGLLPADGSVVNTTIYYKLNDASNNALQHIDVQLVYYTRKSQMSSSLLSDVLLKLNNILTGSLISKSANPRPPLIIITRYN